MHENRRFLVFYLIYILAIGNIIVFQPGSHLVSGERSDTLVHNGLLPAGEVWNASVVHVVEGEVIVGAGNTLIVENGSVVMVNASLQGGKIIIENGAKLLVEGSEGNEVLITSMMVGPASGDYTGIIVENGGLAYINHTNIRYATVGIEISGGDTELNHCQINETLDWGVMFDGTGEPLINDCEIFNTGAGGSYSGGVHMTSLGRILDTEIYNCDGVGIYTSVGDVRIENTLVYNTSSNGLRIMGPAEPIVMNSNISNTWGPNIHVTSNSLHKIVTFIDCIVDNSSLDEENPTVFISGSSSTHLIDVNFINSTIKNNTFDVGPYANVSVKWHLDVLVELMWGQPLSQATVVLLNSSSSVVDSCQTGLFGEASGLVGVEYTYSSGVYSQDREHVIGVVYQGCEDRNVPIVMDRYQSRTVILQDIESPVAVAGADMNVIQGEQVVFDGNGSTDNIGVDNYTWTFTQSEEVITLGSSAPSYEFNIPGEYLVVLNASDRSGNWDLDSINVSVKDVMPPVAKMNDSYVVEQGEELIFDSSNCSDNVGIVNYTWTFQYNETNITLYGPFPTFTFEKIGNYTVRLDIGDQEANPASTTFVVKVSAKSVIDIVSPVASAGVDMVFDQADLVLFNANASEDNVGIVNYTWTFIYGGILTTLFGQETNFTFFLAGSYQVILNVSDAGGNWATDMVNVTINDVEAPEVDAGDDRTVFLGEKVVLDAAMTTDNVGILSYNWTFPDSGLSLSLNVSFEYIFREPGNVTILLNVTDTSGNWATAQVVFLVVFDNISPVANAGSNRTVVSGQTVKFNASASSDNIGVVSYIWIVNYVGTNEMLSGKEVSFTFDIPGTYTIILNVTDQAGNWALDNISVTVRESSSSDDDPDENGKIGENGGSGNGGENTSGIFFWSMLVGGSAVLLFALYFLGTRYLKVREGRRMDEAELNKITTGRMDLIILRKPDTNKFKKYELRRIQGSTSDIAGVFWLTARDTSWVVDRVVTGSREMVAGKIEYDIKKNLNRGYSLDYFGTGIIMRLLGENIF